jgi:transposase
MFFSSSLRIFLYSQAIDMRSGFERLTYYVRESLKQDVLRGDGYLFLGKNRRRAKVLYYDGTGLVLLTKRLEQGIFMAVSELKDVREITSGELSLILSGHRIRYSLATRGRVRTVVEAQKSL